MDMRTYIEMGEKKAGKQAELAKVLGISESYIRVAKAGRNGLPDAICFVLAGYIGVEEASVIAASNLVTEKKEDRRKVFENYLKKTGERTLKTIMGGLIISMLTMTPQSPAEAASVSSIYKNINYTKLIDDANRRERPISLQRFLIVCKVFSGKFFLANSFRGLARYRQSSLSSSASTPAASRRFFSTSI